ncbi:hypothetical protein RA720_001663 [Campylobacter upsaliensis]|nr:hypothetical protein [Campylobacter upsaliensis]ELF6740612.1 hypothetical protein [Campylobacter upsaliensis]
MTPRSDPALRCSFTRLKPHLTLPPLRPSLFFATLKLIHASHEPSLQRPCQCQIHALKPHLSATQRAVFKLVFSFYGA